LQWTADQRRGFLQWKGRLMKRRLQRLVHGGAPVRLDVDELIDLAQYPEDQRRLWETHVRALVHYQPGPYAGRVTLFRSPVHHLVCSFDPEYGWGELAEDGVTVRVVAGTHEKIIEEPHVTELARELRACLAKAQAGADGKHNGANTHHHGLGAARPMRSELAQVIPAKAGP
jgi:thioesterase domain-containing protein